MDNLIQLTRDMSTIYVEKGVTYLENIESCPHFLKFKEALDKFSLEDLNIAYDKEFLYNPNEPLRYMKVLFEQYIGIGVFFLAKGKGFPIHDHPGLMVASKVLDGKISCHSYNPVDFDKRQRQLNILLEKKEGDAECAKELEEGILAEDLGEEVILTGQTEIVTPKERNMHCMEATEDCCMLDIYIPNSSYRHFYSVVEEGQGEDKDLVRVKIQLTLPALSLRLLKYEDYHQSKQE